MIREVGDVNRAEYITGFSERKRVLAYGEVAGDW
jgi:hypothetical protein